MEEFKHDSEMKPREWVNQHREEIETFSKKVSSKT